MQQLAVKAPRTIAGKNFLRETIPVQGGGKRMLSINFLTISLTVSVRPSRSKIQRYEDNKRIKRLREDMLNRRAEMSRYLY
jgi:hypothetical protein